LNFWVRHEGSRRESSARRGETRCNRADGIIVKAGGSNMEVGSTLLMLRRDRAAGADWPPASTCRRRHDAGCSFLMPHCACINRCISPAVLENPTRRSFFLFFTLPPSLDALDLAGRHQPNPCRLALLVFRLGREHYYLFNISNNGHC